MTSTSEFAQLEFLTKLQRILGEGLFVASYKYALLLALAELSVEKSIGPDGSLRIELNELAERFITLYWRQVAPFNGKTLAQNNGPKEAVIIREIAKFRPVAPTLATAHRRKDWAGLVRRVGRTLAEMPLMKLQRVGKDRLDFLYEEKLVDRGIVLRPGVAACFRAQFGVVQALVQASWLSFIQRLPPNRPLLGSMTDLSDFLFGSDRSRLNDIAEGLLALQKGRCFYCAGAVRDGGDVDHFIPWALYKVDLGHNFVLAHSSCNQDKRDMLAATGHLERWVERNDSESVTLGQVFKAARFPFDADASLSVAEWAYENAERARALVWIRCRAQTARLTAEWRECFK